MCVGVSFFFSIKSYYLSKKNKNKAFLGNGYGGLEEKALTFGGGLLQLNMERVKGGGLLKHVEGPTDVVCGVIFMMDGRVSPNMWP